MSCGRPRYPSKMSILEITSNFMTLNITNVLVSSKYVVLALTHLSHIYSFIQLPANHFWCKNDQFSNAIFHKWTYSFFFFKLAFSIFTISVNGPRQAPKYVYRPIIHSSHIFFLLFSVIFKQIHLNDNSLG